MNEEVKNAIFEVAKAKFYAANKKASTLLKDVGKENINTLKKRT